MILVKFHLFMSNHDAICERSATTDDSRITGTHFFCSSSHFSIYPHNPCDPAKIGDANTLCHRGVFLFCINPFRRWYTLTKAIFRSKIGQLFLPSTIGEVATPVRRFLRSSKPDEIYNESTNSEERVGLTGLSTIADLARKVKSSTDNFAYKVWLKAGTNPTEMFTALHLGEAGVKLVDNPKFLQGLKYVDSYNTKKGYVWFAETTIFRILQKTTPPEDLAKLFRQVPGRKNFADAMQNILFDTVPSTHKFLNKAWLKAGESPTEVFKILRLQDGSLTNNAGMQQWLRYINIYRTKNGDGAFSDVQALRLLGEAHTKKTDTAIAPVLEAMKQIPDLNKIAGNMQMSIFQQWVSLGYEPKRIGMVLTPYDVMRFPKSDPIFKTFEAYTVTFAAVRGGKAAMEKVKKLFGDNNPEAALAAVRNIE